MRDVQSNIDGLWILNLSMQFRDRSQREKFFVTYADPSSKWYRVTVSVDYGNIPKSSELGGLDCLISQEEKACKIYEALRESLHKIPFYNTVTNLRVEYDEGERMCIHVEEDANEIVEYPTLSLFMHIQTLHYRENELQFDSHLSGYVYKVKVDGLALIKKEIPGPYALDEFMYEVNALNNLQGCPSVVQLQGLVVDDPPGEEENQDQGPLVKGLLVSYASKGTLGLILERATGLDELSWDRRVKWAQQIVQALSSIHEAGYVQGDFTLSNIVIDENDDALIIDINRRGCPIGWEPPELKPLIKSGQRIGMCISTKTDLYQLGMVLWAIAKICSEPEREDDLTPLSTTDAPEFYCDIVDTCLRNRPQERATASTLLQSFQHNAKSTSESRQDDAAVDVADDEIRKSRRRMDSGLGDIDIDEDNFSVTCDDDRFRPGFKL
ncbi:kinase-like protein [Piedraia hortae CBS 480.64]|uniref:Kinase-like protein n=1 Tax=Piedraia hortae CBS 480.64 TaxID=1314780 RepID=A0A6A7CDE9_9PEZI|nr:kinase-like protein [Piedraia hortae CBS 480.64]